MLSSLKNGSHFSWCTLIALTFLIGCSGAETAAPVATGPRPVKLLTLEGEASGLSREFPGKVEAARRVDLSFQVPGPLIELNVDDGEEVQRGQVMARIRPRDYENRVNQARAQALEAEQTFNRSKELYIRNQTSKADFDRAKSAYDVAKTREQEARDALDDTYLRAPFTGVVGTTFVDNFQDVQAKQPVLSLQDLSGLDVLVDVPERLVSQGGDDERIEAYASFQAAPEDRFPLTLKEMASEADPVNQTYRVTFRMEPPKTLSILPGMTATVTARATGGEETGLAISVPAVAVVADPSGESFVWVVDTQAMTVSKRMVTMGPPVGRDEIAITEGLEPGETIAVSAASRLTEGLQIRRFEP